MKKFSVFVCVIAVLALALSIYAILLSRKGGTTTVKNSDIVFRVQDGYLEWKDSDEDSWTKVLELASIKGKDGINGINGIDGSNGSSGKNGKDGKDGKDGVDGINGINGTNGTDGREVELRVEDKVLQWKYVDEEDTEWRDLIDLSSSTGGGTGGGETSNSIVNSVDGDVSDLGCYTNGEVCTNGTIMNINVNADKALDFYVISDDGTNITLIASSNIGDSEYTTVAWYTASSGNNSYGPVTALTVLNHLTSDWANINAISSYNYNNSGQGYKSLRVTNGETVITDSTDAQTPVPGTTRARLLTYEEAYGLGCRVTAAASNCPDWLYANLAAESNSLTPYGYWLSTAYSNTTRVYNIRNTGILANNAPNDTTGRGIRPVITISR